MSPCDIIKGPVHLQLVTAVLFTFALLGLLFQPCVYYKHEFIMSFMQIPSLISGGTYMPSMLEDGNSTEYSSNCLNIRPTKGEKTLVTDTDMKK